MSIVCKENRGSGQSLLPKGSGGQTPNTFFFVIQEMRRLFQRQQYVHWISSQSIVRHKDRTAHSTKTVDAKCYSPGRDESTLLLTL